MPGLAAQQQLRRGQCHGSGEAEAAHLTAAAPCFSAGASSASHCSPSSAGRFSVIDLPAGNGGDAATVGLPGGARQIHLFLSKFHSLLKRFCLPALPVNMKPFRPPLTLTFTGNASPGVLSSGEGK